MFSARSERGIFLTWGTVQDSYPCLTVVVVFPFQATLALFIPAAQVAPYFDDYGQQITASIEVDSCPTRSFPSISPLVRFVEDGQSSRSSGAS